MKIPKKLYQVWHDKNNLPVFYNKYNTELRKQNPDYEIFLFDEKEIDLFVNTYYSGKIVELYNRIQIITAKVDFWRILYLYKNGGVYLDIDSMFTEPLSKLIKKDDMAIITRESNTPFMYVQWGLIFCKEHPILKKTIENIVDNLKYNRYPNHIGKMTGPYPFTEAVDYYMNMNEDKINRENNVLWGIGKKELIPDKTFKYQSFSYRIAGVEYGKYALSWVPEKNQMYYHERNGHDKKACGEHWTVAQRRKTILKI